MLSTAVIAPAEVNESLGVPWYEKTIDEPDWVIVQSVVATLPAVPEVLPVTLPVKLPVTLPVTLPVKLPVTLPVNAPLNVVVVRVFVLGLYVMFAAESVNRL